MEKTNESLVGSRQNGKRVVNRQQKRQQCKKKREKIVGIFQQEYLALRHIFCVSRNTSAASKARSPKAKTSMCGTRWAPDAGPGSAPAGERMDGFRMASCRRLGIIGSCLDTGGGLWLGRSRGNTARKKRPAAYHLVCGLLAVQVPILERKNERQEQ